MADKCGIHMSVPNTTDCIYPGDICTVPNLGSSTYKAWFGWYIPEDSKPVFGWFFIDTTNDKVYPVKFKYFDGISVT